MYNKLLRKMMGITLYKENKIQALYHFYQVPYFMFPRSKFFKVHILKIKGNQVPCEVYNPNF